MHVHLSPFSVLEKLVLVNASNTSPTCRDMDIIQKSFSKDRFVVSCWCDCIFSADDLVGNAFACSSSECSCGVPIYSYPVVAKLHTSTTFEL